MSDSAQPHRQQCTRLPRPWDSPGKNTGVGCHFLLQCINVKSESEFAQSCPTLCDPMDHSLPGSSVHEIFQARGLEWVAIAFSTLIYRQAYNFFLPGTVNLPIRKNHTHVIQIGKSRETEFQNCQVSKKESREHLCPHIKYYAFSCPRENSYINEYLKIHACALGYFYLQGISPTGMNKHKRDLSALCTPVV